MKKTFKFSWQGKIKQLIIRMAPKKSKPDHKRRVAALLESQATKLRAFADSQAQPPKRTKTGGRRTASGRTYASVAACYPPSATPAASLAKLAAEWGVSVPTACRWRKRYLAESGMIKTPQPRKDD